MRPTKSTTAEVTCPDWPEGGAAAGELKSAPNVFERLWRHRRAAHGVRDRGMSQEVLEPSGVHSPGRERQLSGFSTPLNHASNAHPSERLATLIDKDVGSPFSLLLPLQQPETVHLIPLRVMDAVSAALETADE
jgi:hypothetical protein